MDVLSTLGGQGIIPVVKIDDSNDAARLGEALMKGGLPCVEITFRTHNAGESIQRIFAAQSEMLVGAGTVLSVDQAKQAVSVGASFIVSPGLNLLVVDWCLEQGVTVIPGIATPSEAMLAMSRGLTVLKFFPAEAMGGINYLNAISPALPGARYIPTGGIGAENIIDWLKLPYIHAVAGSWLVTSKLLTEGRFDEITRLASQAVENVKTARQKTEGK
ncbi:MAG: bifunctional 4-hydroxy-2-oxoglutarate aldolase/2-dehydro-3-deoxy-phosphogluconate aldolase [Chloroflexi bacterium]|nr:bifunctional 4-hydroxy-2-oxoglutarate aldolase/2-dehydro-3-deoxy-phosphogluconate aldolase [Chloroflexota bacterium]